MTPQRAKELLPVIQAFAEGKEIQVSLGVHWEDYNGGDADFGNSNWMWRIKPQPREWWLCDIEGRHVAFPTKITDAIHVREVLE